MKTLKITQADYLKANRIGSREAEIENSNGWNSKIRVHKSAKTYSRKDKHVRNDSY
jgi:hypothetical protein